nr:retrovirus-related Pol polyprotein from transposon TNT 1-94 [Tanacetum cinerariifolium]
MCPLTRITSTNVVPPKETTTAPVITSDLKGSTVFDASSSLIKCKLSKLLCGIWTPGALSTRLEIAINSLTSVNCQVPAVPAPEPAISIGTPSSTTIDQDAPSITTTQTTPKTPSPVIPLGVEEAAHGIKVIHMDNNPFVEFPIQEASSEESSTQVAFPNHSYKDSLTESCWIEDMQEEVNEFKCRKVWQLVPRLDRVMIITLKWVYNAKLDELGGVLKNKAHLVARGYHHKEGIDFEESFALVDSLEAIPDTPKLEKSKLEEDPQGKAVDHIRYRGIISTLMYLTVSRPDLVFSVCMCARYQAKPTKKHLYVVKRIFRYLRGTINLGLWYPKDSCIALTAFADVDHASCHDIRKKKQQVATRDDKWVPFSERVKISSTNIRLETTMPQKEETFQVVIDFIKNSTCFKALTISTDVPEIFMQQFWTILDICPRVEGVDFTDVLNDDTALAFLIDIGYKGPLYKHTKMFVDQMHRPWRTLAAIINKCLFGKTTCNDKLRKSIIDILWRMFKRENVDYPELIWEDIAYQIDHMKEKRSSRKNMPYPRFTDIMINHFLKKYDSLSNLKYQHSYTIKDDGIVSRLKFIKIGKDYQEYGLPIPKNMLTEAIKQSESHQMFIKYSTGQIPPKKSKSKGS